MVGYDLCYLKRMICHVLKQSGLCMSVVLFLTASSEHVRRLDEFGTTGSGALTLDEFFDIELEEECDPPSFTRGRISAQEKAMLTEVRIANRSTKHRRAFIHNPLSCPRTERPV